MNTAHFQEMLVEWRRERRLKAMTDSLASQQVDVDNPVKCNHCGQSHIGINCPNRQPYAFMTEPFCPVCEQYGHTAKDCASR
jgi:transposase-like protein